jgi:hypothetical protein
MWKTSAGYVARIKGKRIYATLLSNAFKERGHFETRNRSDENSKVGLKVIECEDVSNVRLERDRDQFCEHGNERWVS